MCLCQSLACFHAVITQIGAKDVICYWNMHTSFSKTVFWDTTPEKALGRLQDSNIHFQAFWAFLSLALNFFLSLDVMLMLRSPFSPHDRRMKFYFGLSFAISAFCTAFCPHTFYKKTDALNTNHEAAIGCVALTVYILFTIFSSTYTYRLTTRPGMSAELRRDFIFRHLCNVFVFILTWLPYLGLTYYLMLVS